MMKIGKSNLTILVIQKYFKLIFRDFESNTNKLKESMNKSKGEFIQAMERMMGNQ